MFGLDEQLAGLGTSGGLLAILVVAVLLGLRHATDPDHLAAVTALVVADEERGSRRAGCLGLAWGAGHATTLTLLGIPIVVLDAYLPEPLQVSAEVLVGVIIMGLGIRLLHRWRHDGLAAGTHGAHPAVARRLRSVRGAFSIGLVHGIGGSAGVGILLLAAIPDDGIGLLALVLFAACTALSMCVTSVVLGGALAGRRVRVGLSRATPAVGACNCAFGAWYALGALGVLPYVF